jgi:uncharacterized protein (TIGR02271 family)
MVNQNQLSDVIGATAYDRHGDKLGKIGHVYYDDHTDHPKWLTVNTGLFGMNESFVPLDGAELTDGGSVTVAFDKALIKDAPNVSGDGHLSPQDEERLYRHYTLEYGTNQDSGTGVTGRDTDTGVTAQHGYRDTEVRGTQDDVRGTRGHDASVPSTDQAMTRSEERLNVGTETRETGRARLRKHVVTEHEQVTVPVSREEVRVEREPVTDANRRDAYDGPAISEDEHEVVLREERPVVDTEAVPVERVTLGTETVREQETVGGEVRKEQVEVDDGRATDRSYDRH